MRYVFNKDADHIKSAILKICKAKEGEFVPLSANEFDAVRNETLLIETRLNDTLSQEEIDEMVEPLI